MRDSEKYTNTYLVRLFRIINCLIWRNSLFLFKLDLREIILIQVKYSRVKDVWMLVVATVAVPISCLEMVAASVDMLDVSAKNVKTCIQFANELGVQEKFVFSKAP